MAAALHDGGGGNDGQLGFLLQLGDGEGTAVAHGALDLVQGGLDLSLIHISEPTRRTPISYAVFCLKKKKTNK